MNPLALGDVYRFLRLLNMDILSKYMQLLAKIKIKNDPPRKRRIGKHQIRKLDNTVRTAETYPRYYSKAYRYK